MILISVSLNLQMHLTLPSGNWHHLSITVIQPSASGLSSWPRVKVSPMKAILSSTSASVTSLIESHSRTPRVVSRLWSLDREWLSMSNLLIWLISRKVNSLKTRESKSNSCTSTWRSGLRPRSRLPKSKERLLKMRILAAQMLMSSIWKTQILRNLPRKRWRGRWSV